MAKNDDNDSLDLTSRRSKKSNTRSTMSSKSNVSNETKDVLKDLDLTSRRVKQINEEKLKGEKKITAEKEKQVKQEKQITSEKKNQVKQDKEINKNQAQKLETEKKITNEKKKQTSERSKESASRKSISSYSNKELSNEIEATKQAIERARTYKEIDESARRLDRLQREYVDRNKDLVKQLKEISNERQDFYKQESEDRKKQKQLQDEINNAETDEIKSLLEQSRKINESLADSRRDAVDFQRQIERLNIRNTDQIEDYWKTYYEGQDKAVEKQEELNEKIKEARDAYKEINNKKTSTTNSILGRMGVDTNSDIFKYLSSDRNDSSLSQSAKDLSKASAKMELAGSVNEIAVDSIKTILNKWLDRFKSGMDNITSVYEDTYSRISATMDINQSQYHDWQNDVSRILQEEGVNNAVTVSEAMTELSRLAKEGFTDLESTSEMSVRNIQNRIINPFVDTITEAYENLQYQFGTNFTKTITGMSGYLSEIAGSNRVFSKSINTVIQNLEPVALASQKELLSGKEYAMIEQAVNDGKMTWSRGINVITAASDVINDPSGALMSGDVGKMSAVTSGAYLEGMDAVLDQFVKIGEFATSDNAISQGTAAKTMGQTIYDLIGSYGNGYDINTSFQKGAENYEKHGGSASDYYEEAIKNMSNGQYTTEAQQKANIAENASTIVATFKEAYPDWYSFLELIASEVGSLVKIFVGSQIFKGLGNVLGKITGIGGGSSGGGLLSGIGSKLSSAGTYVGSGLANGFSNAAPTALGAGKIGAFTGPAGAVAGAAGVAAGGAMAVKGGMDVYNDFKNDDVSWKTGASAVGAVGGAAGAGALLALGASNPIGWAALAVGGIALAARGIAEQVEAYNESMEDSMIKYSKQVDDEVAQKEAQQKKEVNNLKVVEERARRMENTDNIKSLLIENGIATEKELQDERYNQKDALMSLTKEYIESTEKINKATNSAYKGLEKLEYGDKAEYANKSKEFMSYIMKGPGQKKMYEQGEDEREVTVGIIEAIWNSTKDNYDQLGDKEKDIVDKMKEYQTEIEAGTLSWEAVDDIVNTMDNRKTETNNLISSAMSKDEITEQFASNKTIRERFGNIKQYISVDNEKLANTLGKALENDTSKESARQLLDDFKDISGIQNYDDLPSETKEVVDQIINEKGLDSYKIGSNYIPFDQIAQLHKGEAVLTAETTSDLKDFLGTSNIKDWNESLGLGVRDVLTKYLDNSEITSLSSEEEKELLENISTGQSEGFESLVESSKNIETVIAGLIEQPEDQDKEDVMQTLVQGISDNVVSVSDNSSLIKDSIDDIKKAFLISNEDGENDVSNTLDLIFGRMKESLFGNLISYEPVVSEVDGVSQVTEYNEELKVSGIDDLSSNVSEGFQAVSDVVIDQTKQLVLKMDEIISAIVSTRNNRNSYSTFTNRDSSQFSLS